MQSYQQYHAPESLGARPQLQAGVVAFMNGVYGWMAVGLLVTAATAFGISMSPAAMSAIFGDGYGPRPMFGWIVAFAPLAMAWFLPARIPTMERGKAAAVFALFAGTLGAALAWLPAIAVAAPGLVLQALLVTVGVFGGMAVFGYVTKKDLTGMGQFLAMALLGAVIAMVVNIFIASESLGLIGSMLVAVCAAGLTAYHTQAIKQVYLVNGGRGNLAILGALALYVDFINLFLSLLRLFAASRD